MVIAGKIPKIVPGIENIGVIRTNGDVAAFSPSYIIDVGLGNTCESRTAGHGDGRVVLLSAIDPIRNLLISRYMVHLRRRLVVDRGPASAAIEGHTGTAVIPLDHALGVVRIDPQIMIISMRHLYLEKGASSIDRLPALDIQCPDSFWVLGISVDMLVIPRACPEVTVLAQPFPVLAAVIGSKERAILRVDDSPDTVLFSGRDSQADFP